jgi:hypothetical protein
MNHDHPYASAVEGETDLDGDLPMFNGILVDVAPHLFHFKPAESMQGFARAFERLIDGLFNRLGGRPRQFNDFVNVIFHNGSKIRACGRPANDHAEKFLEIGAERRGRTRWPASCPG